MNALGHRLLVIAEGTSWVLGFAGLLWWGAFQIDVARSTQHDRARFAVLQAASLQAGPVDQSLWSSVRINAWRNVSGPASAGFVTVIVVLAKANGLKKHATNKSASDASPENCRFMRDTTKQSYGADGGWQYLTAFRQARKVFNPPPAPRDSP